MTESDRIKLYFTPLRQQIMSVTEIERVAGVPPKTLEHFLSGRRNLPKKHEEAIVRIIESFGYKPELSWSGTFADGCLTCKNNIQGVEAGLWCINNCIAGSKYEMNKD